MRAILAASLLLAAGTIASAAGPLTAVDVMQRADALMRGTMSEGEMEMTVVTPDWRRTMRMRFWEDSRDDRMFVRVLAPAKDRGTASLKLGNEMWMYLPSIERSMKIPPSMMMQSWLGSDLTNDDIVKESSYKDYDHTFLDTTVIDGQRAYVIQSIPKPDAPVVWGKIITYARTSDYLPLRQDYYDDDGQLVRRMTYSDFRRMGGRTIPATYRLVPLTADRRGHETTLRILSMTFDRPIPGDTFTRANLERAR